MSATAKEMNDAFDTWILIARERNKKNPYFKSKMQSIIERQEKDKSGEYFRISEEYLFLDKDNKRKMVSLGQVIFKLKRSPKDKRLRAIFYVLNELKRNLGFNYMLVPAYCNHEPKYD